MAKWLKSEEYLTFRVDQGVATVTLNRPDKRNALSPGLIGEIHGAMLEADDRTDVNVVVLAGAGQDFCAGYDFANIYGGHSHGEAAQAEAEPVYRSERTFDNDAWRLERITHQLLTIFDMHKPVIAQVHGNCLAGGMELALLCDFILAADDAVIGHPGTRVLGTPPINLLVYSVGPQWARRLLLTGDCVSGRDAARIGLVLDAVPAGRLADEVAGLARRIATIDAELLATHKRNVNLALELAGARTLQRLAAETDARAHLAQGPQRTRFLADVAAHGVREASRRRNAEFGDRMVQLNSRD